MNFEDWRNCILDTVNDFIDPSGWLDPSGKIISNPVESNSNLFDDFDIENFIVEHKNNLTEIQCNYGHELIDTINENDHWFEKLPVKELIKHPDFLKIRNAALKFKESFDV